MDNIIHEQDIETIHAWECLHCGTYNTLEVRPEFVYGELVECMYCLMKTYIIDPREHDDW